MCGHGSFSSFIDVESIENMSVPLAAESTDGNRFYLINWLVVSSGRFLQDD